MIIFRTLAILLTLITTTITGFDVLKKRVTISFESGASEIHSLETIKSILKKMEKSGKKRNKS